MNKLLAGLGAVVLVTAAAAGWYVWLRPHDRLALARSLMAHGDVRAAQLALRGVVLDDPANAEAHFRLGEVQLRLADPIAAETELTKARQHGYDAHAIEGPMAEALVAQGRFADAVKVAVPDGLPPERAARVLVARSAADRGLHQLDAARDDAARAEQLAPGSIAAALASADAAHASGDLAAQTRAVARALAIDPRSSAALLQQAGLLEAKGDSHGALAALDQAVAAAPDLHGPRLARAELLIATHQDKQAQPDIAALLQHDPRSPLLNYLQAQLLVRAGDFRGADAALQLVGPALRQVPRGTMLLAVVKAKLDQPEQAAEAADRYLAQMPGDPAAYKLVASIALAAKRPADAADVLDRAVAAGHADAETYDLLGQADAQSGRSAAALRAMQTAADLAPKNAAILSRLAALRLGAGDAASAASDLQHLLDMPIPPADGSASGMAAAGPADNAGVPSRAQEAAALVVASLQAGETARAAAALDRLRATGVQSAQVDALTGLVRLGQLDFPAAQTAFEAAVARDPTAIASQVDLANVLALRGNPAAAEAKLRQVLARNPADPQALQALQRLLLGAGRKDEALAALEAAHAAAPDNAGLTVGLADRYVRNGQAQKALAMLDQDRTATPTRPVDSPISLALLAARARAQQAAGQTHDATDTLRQILSLRPNDLPTRQRLIDALLSAHDFAGARSVIGDGLATHPGQPELLAADVAAAAQEGGLQAGLDRAAVLARDPANLPAARLLRGNLYVAAKKYPEAAAAYAAELHDNAPPSVALSAALSYQAAGQPEKAAALLRAVVAAHPEATDAAAALAVIDISMHELDEARATLQTLLAKRPTDAAALNNLAWVEQQRGDTQQARVLAQRSWLLSSTPQAADTLGWILLGGERGPPVAGQAATGLDLLRQAAFSLPDDPTVQYHYAVALKDNDQGGAAAAILTRLVALPAGFTEQAQARKLLDSLPHS